MKTTLIIYSTLTILLIFSSIKSYSIHSKLQKSIPDEMFEIAWASPQMTMAKNKTALLQLYTQDAIVEDPVGTPPLKGQSGLNTFFDTFIAPESNITFMHTFHIVSEEFKELILYGNLTVVTKESTAFHPLIVFYTLTPTGPTFKLSSIHGYWNALEGSTGGGSIWDKVKLATSIVRGLGLWGAFNYFKGIMYGIGEKGKEWSRQFYNAMRSKDKDGWKKLFTLGKLPHIIVTYTNRRVTYSNEVQYLAYFWRDLVNNENVKTSIIFDEKDVINAGYSVAGVFQIKINDNHVMNASFINEFGSNDIQNIRIWIDNVKFT